MLNKLGTIATYIATALGILFFSCIGMILFSNLCEATYLVMTDTLGINITAQQSIYMAIGQIAFLVIIFGLIVLKYTRSDDKDGIYSS